MSERDVNVDVDASLIPLQIGGGGLPQPVFTPPAGSTFVAGINSQTGNVVLGGGNTGFAYPSGGGTITMTGPLTTKGDLYAYSTLGIRLAVGSNGQILSVDSAQATGLKWINGPPKTNVAAIAPAVTDDSSAGYSINSLWTNTTGPTSYICQSAAVGAAVWHAIP